MSRKFYVPVEVNNQSVSEEAVAWYFPLLTGNQYLSKKIIKAYCPVQVGGNWVSKLFFEAGGGGFKHRFPALAQRYELNRSYNFTKANIYETLEAMWDDILYHIAPNTEHYNRVKFFRDTYTQTIYDDIAQNKTVEDTIYLYLVYTYYTMTYYPKKLSLMVSLGDTTTTGKSLSAYYTWYLLATLSSTISQKTKGFTIEYVYDYDREEFSKAITQGMEQIGEIGRFYDYQEGSVGFTAYDDTTAVQYRTTNIGIDIYEVTNSVKMIADFDFAHSSTLALDTYMTLVFDKTNVDVGISCLASATSINNGLVITNGYAMLPVFWLEGELYNIELDITSLTPYGRGMNYLLYCPTTISQRTYQLALGYNNNSGTWYWTDYNGSTTTNINMGLSGADYFNGHTLRLEAVRSTKQINIYRDDTLVYTVPSNLLFDRNVSIMLGHSSSGIRFTSMIFTGMRVWYS